MPEFILKGGDKPPKEMVDFLAENRGDYLRISLEVESSHDRLRRSFHALIREWFDCGEFSANGHDVKTYGKLRDYYKFEGTDYKVDKYVYRSNEYDSVDEMVEKELDNFNMNYVSVKPKSWKDMTKKEKSNALNCLLTEIRLSMCNNQKVLSWVAKITGDIDLLKDINYHKNTKGIK